MSKKHPKISNKPNASIVPLKTNEDKHIVISYRYLETNNSKYNLDLISDNRLFIQYNNEFNKKMQEYAQHEDFKKYIRENGRYRDRNHIHFIDWKDNRIKESCFTNLQQDLMEQIKDDCWQLGINNQGFRIHGFFIDNVFYIVWLDPMHNLYHRK